MWYAQSQCFRVIQLTMKLLRSVRSIRFISSLVFSAFLAHTAIAASDDLLLAARDAEKLARDGK